MRACQELSGSLQLPICQPQTERCQSKMDAQSNFGPDMAGVGPKQPTSYRDI